MPESLQRPAPTLTHRIAKRALDLAVVVPLLPWVTPLVALLAVAVRLDAAGPAFFVQERVGRGRQPIRLVKLRTMVTGAETRGPLVTAAGDIRVTRLGAVLRRTKLDELPQLFQVLTGDLSLVGPRPEAARYVAHYREEWLRLFEVRPGITDLASLTFRDEEVLLEGSLDRERAYLEAVLPAKLALAIEGLERSSLRYDLRLLARTVTKVLRLDDGPEHPAVAGAREEVEELNQRLRDGRRGRPPLRATS